MREVHRCLECKLVQYMTFDGKCRRCHVSFFAKEIPAEVPVPVYEVAEFVQITDLRWAFAKVLKVCRLAKGWSQRDMARELKVARSYISVIESQRKLPAVGTMLNLSNVFGVTPRFLIQMIEGAQEL